MARPKGSKNKEVVEENIIPCKESSVQNTCTLVVPLITKLSVDYPSEGLNNMAIKINEIIDAIQKS